jgi:hypothetical protein
LKTNVAKTPVAIVFLVVVHEIKILEFGATSKNC